MSIQNAVLILSISVTIASGQFLNCGFINSLDCTIRTTQIVCGSDGQDYQNRCYLAKEQCKDSSLHIITDQSCSSAGYTASPVVTTTSGSVGSSKPTGSTGPTTTVEPLFQNHDQLLDYFCWELMHESCPKDTEQVCGSDNVTYDNICEYEKQRCSHRGLSVKNFGPCS